MKRAPLITKILCVALVASVVMPVGREIYPYVGSITGSFNFDAAEAVFSATLGFALYTAMFG